MNAVLARLRRRLSFANVTSGVALFIALGGTSYAAITLPDNSVGTAQIRTGGVGKREIQTGAVAKAEIRTGGVGQSEIRTGAVGKGEVKTGAIGTAEIRTNGIGKSEIRKDAIISEKLAKDSVTEDKVAKDAIGTDEIKDNGIAMADLNAPTRSAIAGGAYHASVLKGGTAAGGNAKTIAHTAGSGDYTVDFGADVSKCTAVASPATVKSGTNTDTPDAGALVTVAPGAANTQVVVHTFTPAAAPTATPNDPHPNNATDEPFNLVVAC